MLAAKCQYKLRIQTGLHNKTDMHQSEQKYLLQSQGDTGFLDAPARQSSGESQRVSAFFCNTKEGGHAPAAASTFGATAYKKPVWHYDSSKSFPAIGACPPVFATHVSPASWHILQMAEARVNVVKALPPGPGCGYMRIRSAERSRRCGSR